MAKHSDSKDLATRPDETTDLTTRKDQPDETIVITYKLAQRSAFGRLAAFLLYVLRMAIFISLRFVVSRLTATRHWFSTWRERRQAARVERSRKWERFHIGSGPSLEDWLALADEDSEINRQVMFQVKQASWKFIYDVTIEEDARCPRRYRFQGRYGKRPVRGFYQPTKNVDQTVYPSFFDIEILPEATTEKPASGSRTLLCLV